MESLMFMVLSNFILRVMPATTRGARTVGRMAALHPTGRTPHAVQLTFLG